MLQKVYLTVKEYLPEHQTKAVVLRVDTAEEFLAAEAILKKHIHRFRGIQLKSSLFQLLLSSLFSSPSACKLQGIANNFSIILEDVTHMQNIITTCKEKYVELILPYELLQADCNTVLKQCERANRIIISFEKEEQLSGLQDLLREFVVLRRFPLTQNVPLCKIDVKFASEIYVHQVVVNAKPQECNGCIMQKYCLYEGQGFVVQPILNNLITNEKYKEVLSFLHNEDPIARF